MNPFQIPDYRKWLLLGLLAQVIAAWFSVGYHHPDEHFQILEFCNYKLGHSTPSDLQWEFLVKCRAAFLPFIAYLLSKILICLHLFNPIVAAFILRLFMGLFTWSVSYQLIKQLLPEFTTTQGRNAFVLLSMLLWYVPYIGVRLSAENFAGLLFFQSVVLVLKTDTNAQRKNIALLLLTGFLLAIALFVRLQMAFAVMGLGIWLLFIRKRWQPIFIMLPGALLGVALCLAIDYWFYGSFVLTPYNYYAVNIINNIAVQWGVSPWWYYLSLFLQSAVIPISIALLVLFVIGIRKKTVHLFSIVIICFIIGHSLIGHKEMRFLFPMNMGFIFIVCTGIDAIVRHYNTKPILANTIRLLAIMNAGLLLFKILTPAQEAFAYFGYLYNKSKDKTTALWSLKESPYCLNGAAVNFFKPRDLEIYVERDLQSIVSALRANKDHTLFLSKTLLSPSTVQQYNLKRTYCFFPDFVLKFNINNWEERSNIWAIYQAK